MNMHNYPVVYFNLSKDDFQPEQIPFLLNYEKEIGCIKLDTDICGLHIDFNGGIRASIPAGNWHVIISDDDSGIIGYDSDISESVLISAEKYFIRWKIDVYKDSELVFSHVMDLSGEKVYFFLAGNVLGDTIAVLPYLREIRDCYKCEVYFKPSTPFIDICNNYFPDINLCNEIPDDCYAAYCLALFQKTPYLIPDDSRLMTVDAAMRLQFNLPKTAPKQVYGPTSGRRIMERYVCISVHGSGIMKRWLHPEGWNTVVKYLKELGYKVFCIDGEAKYSEEQYCISIPDGAEDCTGMLPLMERINLLSYADFFIGIPSGLSWLAYVCDIPVVLISGFSLPYTEFDTAYRVMNTLVCHGCYNSTQVNWKDKCPYHKGTDREYECTKMITPKMVIRVIERLMDDIARRDINV